MSDDGPPTPIRGSGAYPIWRNEAQILAAKLAALGTGDARLMAGEMLYYEEIFASWSPSNRPTDADRTRIITEFATCFHRALALLKSV